MYKLQNKNKQNKEITVAALKEITEAGQEKIPEGRNS